MHLSSGGAYFSSVQDVLGENTGNNKFTDLGSEMSPPSTQPHVHAPGNEPP